jgi:hypothetical protein
MPTKAKYPHPLAGWIERAGGPVAVAAAADVNYTTVQAWYCGRAMPQPAQAWRLVELGAKWEVIYAPVKPKRRKGRA